MLSRDLRYALRSLKKSPGFVAVAVLSLGLGLALVSTMFALLDSATHPYAPYRDADRLYRVYWWLSGTEQPSSPQAVYDAVRDQTRSFETVLPVAGEDMKLEVGGEVVSIPVAEVPGRLLTLLGVKPRLGRVLSGADAGSGAMLLGDALWRQLFPGRASLAGATVTLNGQAFAVVGVMPRGMTFPFGGGGAWLALPDDADRALTAARNVWPLVKLKAGVSREAAQADLGALATKLTRLYKKESAPFAFGLSPLRDDPMRLKDIHFAMLGAAVAVLLIACTNLANLMLARGLAKRREVALRLAIGASRSAVVWQMFAECALLTVAGAALGAILSVWGVGVLTSRVPRNIWWLGIVVPRLSWRVFVLAALAAAGSAVLSGLIPATRIARAVSLDEPLKDGAGTTGRTRHRYSGLVVSEIGLALVLLMGAGLLIRVVHRLAAYDFGFPARQMLRVFAVVPDDRARTAGERLAFQLATVAALRTVSGVAQVAAESDPNLPGYAVTAEMAADSTRVLNLHTYASVTPSYLRTMSLPILDGRDFVDGDLAGRGVAILNAAAAASLYPHQRAVGRMVKLGAPMSAGPWIPVIGVCRIALMPPPEELATFHAEPKVYVVGGEVGGPVFQVVLRAARDADRLQLPIGRKLQTLGPRVGRGVMPYLYAWEMALRARSFLAQLFITMGAFALILAAVGIYGVLAYAVNRRVREFAVRIALGAQGADLLKTVLHDGLVMTLAGTGLGAFVALWSSYLYEGFLEDIYPTDALTLLTAEAVLIAVTVVACLAPAFRAMRADPIEILRAT